MWVLQQVYMLTFLLMLHNNIQSSYQKPWLLHEWLLNPSHTHVSVSIICSRYFDFGKRLSENELNFDNIVNEVQTIQTSTSYSKRMWLKFNCIVIWKWIYFTGIKSCFTIRNIEVMVLFLFSESVNVVYKFQDLY